MEVKVYSTPTCPYCKMVKEYLNSKAIEYTDFDVSQDREAAEEMVKLSGQMGVPVVAVGRRTVIGFDKEKLNVLLKIT